MLKGEISIPGDKSVSHRGVMFGAIAEGTTHISNFLSGADCLSTIDCFCKMGVEIEVRGRGEVIVHGAGLRGLKAPQQMLDVGNSGTTMRLISGILSGQSFETVLTGDASIQKRPMKRIITPLSMMGASIESLDGSGCAPLKVIPGALRGITYDSPVASAQVKSCILLAGLYAQGETVVREPVLSRDHTERMLRYLGVPVISNGATASVNEGARLTARDIKVPGDISSAAYFIAAAALCPGSELLIKNVGLNPTRDGILKVLKAMGGDYTIVNEDKAAVEPTGDILVRYSPLHGTVIEGDIIPTLIDEIPVIAIMAAGAEGETVIRDAAELRVKESDRIAVMTDNLKAVGIDASPTPDGMVIKGGRIEGGKIDSHKDHRIAMSFAIADLISKSGIEIKDRDCVDISYPGFFEDLKSLMRSD